MARQGKGKASETASHAPGRFSSLPVIPFLVSSAVPCTLVQVALGAWRWADTTWACGLSPGEVASTGGRTSWTVSALRPIAAEKPQRLPPGRYWVHQQGWSYLSRATLFF